jgi:hypothetical protein
MVEGRHDGPLEARGQFLAGPTTLAIVIVVGLVVAFPRRLHWDPALYVDMGDRIARGALPFRDVFDLNPPLIHYLHAAVSSIALWLSVPSTTTFLIVVVATYLCSLWAVLSLLADREPARLGPLLWSLAVLGIVQWQFDFGQREHLYALTYLPLLLLRWRRSENLPVPGHPWTVCIGVAGGLMACLKPHLLAAALLVELWLWCTKVRRANAWVAPEVLGAAAIGVGYATLLATMPADARHAFWGWLVPLVRAGYGTFDAPLWGLLDQAFSTILALGLALILRRWRPANDTPWRRLGDALVVWALLGLAAYAVQNKGWPYHLLPARTASVAACAVYFGNREWSRRSRQAIGRAAGVATAIVGLHAWTEAHTFDAPDRLAELVDHFAPAPRQVAFVMTDDRPSAWLASLGRSNARSFTGDFPLRMLPPMTEEKENEIYWASLRRDLASDATSLVLIEDRGPCSACKPGESVTQLLRRRRILPAELLPLGPLCALETSTGRYTVWIKQAPEEMPCR